MVTTISPDRGEVFHRSAQIGEHKRPKARNDPAEFGRRTRPNEACISDEISERPGRSTAVGSYEAYINSSILR